MQQPKISVIVPVYNVSKYLSKCLDSILNQTLKEIEVIIINDCSIDLKDDLICKDYASKDSRIVYVKNDVNIGLGFTRNVGLKISKGEYISFIDSDDYLIDNTSYEVCYNKLKEDDYDFISFKILEIDEYGSVSKAPWFYNEIYRHVKEKAYYSNNGFLDKVFFYTIGGNFLSSYSVDKIYKKEFLNKYNIEFVARTYEDRPFSMAVYHHAKKIYVLDIAYYAYLINKSSISRIIDKNSIDSLLGMVINEYQYLVDNDLFKEFKNMFMTISLVATLRNIIKKIQLFTDNKSDEVELLKYYNVKLKESILIDLIFYDCNTFLSIFRPIGVRQSHKKQLINVLKNIFIKLLNKKWHLNKFLKIKGEIYLQLISIYGKYYNLEQKNIWIISERDDEAKDNGYAMFKYLRENYPNINVYYFIKCDRNNKDYLKVKTLGNILNVGSFKALAYYIYAKYCLSTHSFINSTIFQMYHHSKNAKHNPLKNYMNSIRSSKKFVFLQHGIIKDCLPKNSNIFNFDYFVSGAYKEYHFLKHIIEGGNHKVKLIYTGLARYDYLDDLSNNKKQILLMPTWREELVWGRLKDKNFTHSDYYMTYQSLINNDKLISLLENSGYQLIFCPHYEINSRFIHVFSTSSKNITIANINSHDVGYLIKTSKLLITDYSSVFWDFAYLQKPIIHYQFDKEFFRTTQYKEGYFNYERDGFGDVLETEDVVVNKIEYYLNNNFKSEPEYLSKVKEHFTYNDKNNCKRILEAIDFNYQKEI